MAQFVARLLEVVSVSLQLPKDGIRSYTYNIKRAITCIVEMLM